MEDWDPGRWLRGRLAWEGVLDALRDAADPDDSNPRRRDRSAQLPPAARGGPEAPRSRRPRRRSAA